MRCVAVWTGLWAAVGCGGAVSSQQGDAGPVATCGGNCSSAQVAASCSATCDKIARAGCAFSARGTDCGAGCAMALAMAPSCASEIDAYLRCAESTEPTCTQAGDVMFPGCESAMQALQACGSSSTTMPPSGGACAVPTTVCPAIPRPAGGPSSCLGGGGGGPAAPTMSTSSCQDQAGNTWSASCIGSICTCSYNGHSSCTCTMTTAAGACNSCCPGAS
jgi:hypothetical protein